ncbi:MAG: hypothetical protein ACOX3Q_11885 [Clostridia bacterium]
MQNSDTTNTNENSRAAQDNGADAKARNAKPGNRPYDQGNNQKNKGNRDKKMNRNRPENKEQAAAPNPGHNQKHFNKGRPRSGKGPKYNRQVMPGETIEDIAGDITRIEKELELVIEEISHITL